MRCEAESRSPIMATMPKYFLPPFILAMLALSSACPGDVPEPPTSTAGTGLLKIDLITERLLDRDVDGLLDLVQLTPRDCMVNPPVDGPVPRCEPGQLEGSPVEVFLSLGCVASTLTTTEEIAREFRGQLSMSTQWSLYAVVRGQVFYGESRQGYGIAVTKGPLPSPSPPGLLWHVGEEGKMDGLYVGCGGESIAQMIDSAMPGAEYVVGPIAP